MSSGGPDRAIDYRTAPHPSLSPSDRERVAGLSVVALAKVEGRVRGCRLSPIKCNIRIDIRARFGQISTRRRHCHRHGEGGGLGIANGGPQGLSKTPSSTFVSGIDL